MRTDDFDYELPSGLIAQSPAEPRDSCRLMVIDRASGQIDHRVFRDLPDCLRADDLLVVNETRVLPARLRGTKDETGGAVEVLLLREAYENTWECLVKPGRRVRPGTRLSFGDGVLTGLVVDAPEQAGVRLIQFKTSGAGFLEVIRSLGEVPLPPYVTKPLDDPEKYQTVFARDPRSAAAPTAGLHFTEALVEVLCAKGVGVERVELDVGLDTFRPVGEDDPFDHVMHSERFRVPERTVAAAKAAREKGGRVIAVGTTTVRALESAYDEQAETLVAAEGSTDLFILPGFRFMAIDAMITNFHVPRSTLMMMVSAFAGRDLVMHAYEVAVSESYRFLSFGDAMLIV